MQHQRHSFNKLAHLEEASFRTDSDLRESDLKRPIRVGFLTPSFLMGGAERWMVSLIRNTCSKSLQWTGVALIPPDSSGIELWQHEIIEQIDEVTNIYTASRQAGDFTDLVEVMDHPQSVVDKLVSESDILISWGLNDFGDLDMRSNLPHVFVSQGPGEWTANAVRECASACTHYVGVSRSACEPFDQLTGIIPEVIPNGIQPSRCETEISKVEARRQFGIPDDAIAIAYVGRYSPEKNPLAAAMAVRRFDSPNVYAVYCGTGWREEQVKSDVVSLVGDRAIFIPFQDNVGDVLRAIDVFVLASPGEGFSIGLTEAWYAGVPTVATRVGALPELETEFGHLVAPVPIHPSPQELVEAVSLALTDEFRSTIVPRAQLMVREHFTVQKIAETWTEYLTSLVHEWQRTKQNPKEEAIT